MKRLRGGILTWVGGYAASVTTITAAIVLSRTYAYEGVAIGFASALMWQAVVYFSWLPLAALLALLGRHIPQGRDPWRSPTLVSGIGTLLILPLHALLTAWATWFYRPIPSGGRPAWQTVGMTLLIDRLPVDMLTTCAILGILYATVHHGALRAKERLAAEVEW